MKLPNQLTVINYKTVKFVVFDAPCNTNIDDYVKELQKHQIKNVVRCCDATYEKDKMIQGGINVYEMAFADGDMPPKEIYHKFLELVEENFSVSQKKQSQFDLKEKGFPIGVHCIAGLG
jgi:protein tyrosine phosphatase type 4A